jgi:hypothetical protein
VDLFRGALTWRRLWVLVHHLPVDSASRRAMDEATDWGLSEQLLAAIVDTLQGANWQRGGGKGPKPKPLPRPGVHERRPRITRHGHASVPPEAIAAYLSRFAPPDPDAEGS